MPLNIYALYSSRQYLDAKIRTWVDFLRGGIADDASRGASSVKGIARRTG